MPGHTKSSPARCSVMTVIVVKSMRSRRYLVFQHSSVPDCPSVASSSIKWKSFWRDACAIQGSITPHVLPNVLLVGLIASAFCAAASLLNKYFGIDLSLPLAPYELVGAALGLLLVLRTNAGYDRWWEARKLWGGIVNQSRNLAIMGLTYGPNDETWRHNFVRLIAVFPHTACMTLRGERSCEALESLVSKELVQEILTTKHPAVTVVLKLATLLRQACEIHKMDRFFFLQADRERALLIDYLGACERILKTPLALAYSIKIRRFIALFILTLPFALMHSFDNVVLIPLVTMLAAYPLFSLDQLGIELQNPFNRQHLSHLPLNEISAGIEANLISLLSENQISGHADVSVTENCSDNLTGKLAASGSP